MKTYYWRCEKKSGFLSEGKYNFLRRLIGRIFLSETFTVLGEWQE